MGIVKRYDDIQTAHSVKYDDVILLLSAVLFIWAEKVSLMQKMAGGISHICTHMTSLLWKVAFLFPFLFGNL